MVLPKKGNVWGKCIKGQDKVYLKGMGATRGGCFHEKRMGLDKEKGRLNMSNGEKGVRIGAGVRLK